MDTSNLSAVTGILAADLDQLFLVQKLNLLDKLIDDAEARVKSLKAARAELQNATLDWFADMQITSMKARPVEVERLISVCTHCHFTDVETIKLPAATVYQQKSNWARLAEETPEAFAALRAAGLGAYIQSKVNAQSLSAWFRRELEENPDYKLPASLENYVKISQGFDIRTRKS